MTKRYGDIQLERDVIAGALYVPEYRQQVLSRLKPVDFTSATCRDLFKFIAQADNDCTGTDQFDACVRQHLSGKLDKLGWTVKDYFPADLDTCLQTLRKWTVYRQFIKLTANIDFDILRFDDFIQTVTRVGGLTGHLIDDEPDMGQYIRKARNKLEGAYNHFNSQKKPKAFPLFLPYLQNRLTGIYPGEYWIVAGRPGHGKSTFAMNMAVHGAQRGERPLVVTLEMPPEDYLLRAACMLCGCNTAKVRSGNMSAEELSRVGQAVFNLKQTGLDFLDIDRADIDKLLLKVRAKVAAHKTTAVILDQINNVDTGNRRPYEAVTDASRKIRGISKELKIPFVVVSQLNRELEKRSGESKPKLPKLSDLRESGALEQDAVAVIMLCWPYKITNDERHKDAYWLKIAKSRYTHTGQVLDKFRIDAETSKIWEVADYGDYTN